MTRKQSREKRHAAFMNAAEILFEGMETWYDGHPEASFEEIEAEARKRRRVFMGESLSIWVNGRDTGYQVEGIKCKGCGSAMEFEGYRKWGINGLEGESELERAYYVCPKCKGETIFPPG
jgi:hypothetical protein